MMEHSRRGLRFALGAAAALGIALAGGATAPAVAQTAPPSAPTVEAQDVEALVGRVRERLSRMDAAAAERDRALRELEQQVDAAAGALSSTGDTATSLRARAAELNQTVEALNQDRASLTTRLEGVEGERERRVRDLETRVAALGSELAGAQGRSSTLQDELDSSRLRLAALEGELAARDRSTGELQGRLAEREGILAGRISDLERATTLLAATKGQLEAIERALDRSEGTVQDQRLKIDELGAKLNEALAREVEQLSRYRSEFFGRLREALGERGDVRVVGDRFVFPSELLFASGAARLDPAGEAQLDQLARTLRDVSSSIPDDIDWVLRVDGHTDRQALRADAPFRSNWELSTERALAVVEFLTRRGIPPERLAATGFGEFRPLDAGSGEPAFRRNRRIEFKLTEG